MKHPNTLSLSLLLSISSACGLIKVNGKPLGGSSGATSSASTSSEPASGSTSGGSSGDWETTEQYEARQKQMYAEQDRKDVAVKAGQPKWCDQYSIGASKDVSLADFKKLDQPGRDLQLSAMDFAEVMCSTRGEHLELRPKVMELRAAWMKQHGLDESDFEVVVAERKNRGWDDQRYSDFDGPVGQIGAASLLRLDVLGAKASMLARVSFVAQCPKSSGDRGPGTGLLEQIQCAQEPLDAARAYAEIEATKKLNIQTRFHLRQFVRTTLEQQAGMRADLAAKAKEEPGIAQLIAIAQAQRKDWGTPSPARTKLLQLLETMEAATTSNKRSAFAGCEATTRAAWADAVRTVDVPKVSSEHVFPTMITATFRSPEAYLAYQAFKLCAVGSDADFSPQLEFVGVDIIRRGPRTSTIAAWYAASGEIKFDGRELGMANLLGGLGGSQGSRIQRESIGTIERVTARGGKVEITFKQDIGEREDCINWKKTNRIESISAGGAVNYENVCLARGRVKYDRTPDDLVVSSFIGQGLKPGMFLLATEDGLPIVATAGTSSSKAVWLFGVSLTK